MSSEHSSSMHDDEQFFIDREVELFASTLNDKPAHLWIFVLMGQLQAMDADELAAFRSHLHCCCEPDDLRAALYQWTAHRLTALEAK